MAGNQLSEAAQAAIAASAASFAGEGRRVLLHPLLLHNNSMGGVDILPWAKRVEDVVSASKALLIGGSLQAASVLAGKEFVVVQELFETETTDHADVVLPAASFAEADGTFTNNAGNVQRVRKSIDPVHQSKPDWMITSLIAAEMGVDLATNFCPGRFRALADAVPAYEGLRYPALKDESKPVQAKYSIEPSRDISAIIDKLKASAASLEPGEKITETPRIGHKLHRLTTMTSKTAQFHLLAHGNPKPDNLLVAPLVQFNPDGTPREEAESATVGIADRAQVGGTK
ncbi:MAG: molybdopterin-dependent oxidoreductase [Acidobacteria bacterium]|nr:molybdopterin-dependent oxidoreductase [Acidobacteriota bacterium]